VTAEVEVGEPCSIVNVGCDAPAGYLYGDTVVDAETSAEYQCESCWEPVCGSCSRVMKNGERWCDACSEDHEGQVAERPELPPQADGSIRVMARMCSTCVFGTNAPIRPGRMRDLEQQWQAKDCHQVCHHAGTGDEEEGFSGEDIVCHGFLRNVFLRHGTGQLLRIAERTSGGFNYVEPPPLGNLEGER
jgi:hypothetical protein